MPKVAAPTHGVIRFAPVRSRSRNGRVGGMGCSLRVSITANAASRTTDAASETTTLASPQWEPRPGWWPRWTARRPGRPARQPR